MNRRLYLKICATLGMSCFALANPLTRAAMANTLESSLREYRQLRFNITLKNLSNHEVVNPLLWLYLPANSSKHYLSSLKVSMNYHLDKDVLNQNIMKLDLPTLGPFSTKLISVTAQIGLIRKAERESIDMSLWMQPEYLIESNALRIKLLAQELKQAEDFQTCYAIYKWISEHINYSSYIADNLGALYALNHLSGDCTEFACLAVALARANGVPARMVGGYVTDKDAVIQAKDYHHWAEVYFEDQWHLLDAQKKNWLEPAFDYVPFNFYQTHNLNQIGPGKRYKLSDDLIIEY